jgi:hypothetical protein
MSYFTFYADLIGISSAYAASPEQAYLKLHEYYNDVFYGLTAYYADKPDRKVEMYSDSLVVTGDDPVEFLESISPVYMKLLSKGLLLRGGIVSGKLAFDIRMEAKNFPKKLPDSDILARCVALERKTKGARLVIEGSIALQILDNCPDWATLDGYASNPRRGVVGFVTQRSIIPLSDGTAFELLYPLLAGEDPQLIGRRIEEMDYMIAALPTAILIHYAETKRLLEHSQRRFADQSTEMPKV